jgi:hypothetical protein
MQSVKKCCTAHNNVREQIGLHIGGFASPEQKRRPPEWKITSSRCGWDLVTLTIPQYGARSPIRSWRHSNNYTGHCRLLSDGQRHTYDFKVKDPDYKPEEHEEDKDAIIQRLIAAIRRG